jgi:hypothetical protein
MNPRNCLVLTLLLAMVAFAPRSLAQLSTGNSAGGVPNPTAKAANTPEQQRFFADLATAPQKQGEFAGKSVGQEFSETAPGGGVLVGLELWSGHHFQQEVICGVRGIYQTADGRVRGESHGACKDAPSKTFEAPEGSAIACVEAMDDGAQLIRVRLEYRPIHYSNATLDGTISARSDWFGDEGKDGKKKKVSPVPHRLDSHGRPALGIFGTAESGFHGLYRFGLISFDKK